MTEEILTLQEVAEYLKVDEKTVYRMVKSSQLPAFKVRNQWRFRKDAIGEWTEAGNISENGKIELPIVGRVAAGMPILAEENIEGSLLVDRSLVGQSNSAFILRVKGSSMENAGILHDDFIVVQQQLQVNQGEIAVVLFDDEATVKRVYKEKDRIRLQPENDSMKPIYVNPKQAEVSIIGKVKAVIRKI
jgi:SOS regulatory protein LexA